MPMASSRAAGTFERGGGGARGGETAGGASPMARLTPGAPPALRACRRRGGEVGRVRLADERHVRRARESELDRLFTLVAEPVAHARGEPLVRDPDVLADAEARHARQRLRRRLEDQADGARFALRSQHVGEAVQAHRVLAPDPEAVLEGGPARLVIVGQLHQAALLGPHHLVDRLRVLVGGLAHLDLAALLPPAKLLLLLPRAPPPP